MHLDGFQRVVADPSSVSVIRYTEIRPFVLHVNHTGARLSGPLRAGPPEEQKDDQRDEKKGEPSSDAVVGGTTD
jgi:hypothetical protein